MDLLSVRLEAKREIQEELFREEVEKEKIRLKRPWWRKIFPWRIKITKETL